MEGPRTEVRLLLMPTEAAGSSAPAPVNPGCLAATSLLPAPGPDPSIYLIIGERLYVTHSGWPRPEPIRLSEAVPQGLRFARLLALSAEDPQRLLATMRIAGNTADELWQIQLRDRAVVAAQRAHDEPAFASEPSFFRSYHAPRCQTGGSRCLVVSESEGRYYLDQEAARGQVRTPLRELGAQEVRDAAWARDDAAYVLAACSLPATGAGR